MHDKILDVLIRASQEAWTSLMNSPLAYSGSCAVRLVQLNKKDKMISPW